MKKLTALLMALLMVATMMTTAMADGETGDTTTTSAYTPLTPSADQVEVTHTLNLAEGLTSLLYNITYSFEVATEADVVQPADVVNKSWAVTGFPTIADIEYTPADEFKGANVSKTKELVIDWSDVVIKQPGVYRWAVTKACSDTDELKNPTNNKENLYLYVYVIDNGGLTIAGAGLTTNINLNSTGDDVATDKGDLNDTYPSTLVDLAISKTVTGTQGSKDQYFKFEVHLTAPAGAAKASYDINNAVVDVPKTAYHDKQTNPTVVELTGGSEKIVYLWLKDGQTSTIKGLPYGTKYTIVEDKSGYSVKSIEVTGDPNVKTNDILTATVTDDLLNNNATVAYTNEKNATVPTGIDLQTSAPIFGLLMAMAMMFMAFAGKRKEQMN